MSAIPYSVEWAARVIGCGTATGMLVGLIVATLRNLRRG